MYFPFTSSGVTFMYLNPCVPFKYSLFMSITLSIRIDFEPISPSFIMFPSSSILTDKIFSVPSSAINSIFAISFCIYILVSGLLTNPKSILEIVYSCSSVPSDVETCLSYSISLCFSMSTTILAVFATMLVFSISSALFCSNIFL